MSETVYVTNNWEKTISYEYGCNEYVFPKGKTVKLSINAARHIFGYGEQDKVPYMANLGIIQTTNDIPEGLKILSKFDMYQEEPVMNDSLSPVVEQVPLPHKRGGGKFLPMQQ